MVEAGLAGLLYAARWISLAQVSVRSVRVSELAYLTLPYLSRRVIAVLSPAGIFNRVSDGEVMAKLHESHPPSPADCTL